ncbi:hypothetical protein ALP8811_00176 [Aliiroseovarius pelagivivens]|uniref:Lipoprotein n=1 Tax=Aliiroseovarius pelagivivens TaxID=1639690 RepID=A0A2R8AGK0_9RHOB|nr:hypothetical protein [Aliiroseovarius pelagivivens]SPF75191.1 hypothetical protein ALP8811_00176 [Aliiroseovarius pelagivivens]
MKLLNGMALALTLAAFAGCKSTNDLQSQFVLKTSTAAACGPAAAARVERELAAVETLRRGYDRFEILSSSSANNTRATVLNSTDADAYDDANVYGNTANGVTVAYFGNQKVHLTGAHETNLYVHMFKPRDRGYKTAIDAKEVLGDDWKAVATRGIHSCN